MRHLFLLLPLTIIAAGNAAAQTGLARDSSGWTIFTPSADSRIVYVDSVTGADATGGTYGPTSPEVGADPFQPQGLIRPYQTIAAARARLRSGSPDWMLLRRGSIWNETLGTPPSGRSPSERTVIAWYGSDGAMPLIRTGQTKIMQANFGLSYLAIAGLDFHAHTRDPANPAEYLGPGGEDGIILYTPSTAARSLLWEGCRIRCYENGLTLQSTGPVPEDIVIRRCVVLDSYNEGGHSQGLFTAKFQLRLEESIFDHNGWQISGTGNNSRTGGAATIFNHNTYCSSPLRHVFQGNLFLRPSSIGNKWRSDTEGSGSDIVVDNNFYAEGELGISLGGNTDEAYRFARSQVTNNIMMYVGRTKPTGRAGLAWYLEFIDQTDGLVADNLFLHQEDTSFSNAFGINLKNTQRNVRVLGNIVYNINSKSLILSEDVPSIKENLLIEGNEWQQPVFAARLVDMSQGLRGSTGTDSVTFANNRYHSAASANSWFALGSTTANTSFPQWVTASGETGAVAAPSAFPDSSRRIESYQAALGQPADFASFLSAVRAMGRFHWDERYTAARLNDHIRAGFFGKLDLWRFAHFHTPRSRDLAADLADPDGDGMPNLLEWATGGDPLAIDANPSLTVGVGAAGSPEFRVTRNDEVEGTYPFLLEWSTSLAEWRTLTPGLASSGPDEDGITITIAEHGNSPDDIVVTFPPNLASPSLFVRLRVLSPGA